MKMHQHNAAYALVLLPPITLLNPLRTSQARRRRRRRRFNDLHDYAARQLEDVGMDG
jgi:uncharacterized protein YjiS (DUF1127 family)